MNYKISRIHRRKPRFLTNRNIKKTKETGDKVMSENLLILINTAMEISDNLNLTLSINYANGRISFEFIYSDIAIKITHSILDLDELKNIDKLKKSMIEDVYLLIDKRMTK